MITTPVNHFKQQLAAGAPLDGLWMSLCSPLAAEALGLVGFDWLLIDTEHAPADLAQVQPLLQAASAGNSSLVVRPAWNDKVLIKRALDMGAQTLLIPFVQTAEEAAAAVEATRYPPEGIRGVAGATRASRYGLAKDYFARANSELAVLTQVETVEALERLEEIAAVPGVDGVFIGPSDLAASFGKLGSPADPVVQDAIQSAAARLAKVGTPAGILATNATDARRYRDWGFQFVAGAVDLGLMMRAAAQTLADMKS